MTTTTVARYLIERLGALGVRHVFGIPGDYVLGFYGQLERSELTLVNTADEQGAGFAADGYARMNGIGAVCVTYGVGGLKLVNSTAQAFAERSPVVVISGAPGMRERVREPLLHHKIRTFESQLVVFREVTCAAAIVTDAESAQRVIDRTLAACLRSSRPVYLELPRDLVDATFEVAASPSVDEASDQAALDEALAETAALIAAAREPVILAGEELARFGLSHELPTLIERTGIPAAVTTLSKSVIDETHPLFLGVYEGALGHESTRAAVERSDLLIILGANLSDATLGIDTARLDPARTVHASADHLTVRRHHYAGVRFIDFVRGLSSALAKRSWSLPVERTSPPAWVTEPDAPITIARLFQRLNRCIDRDTAVVADVGDALFAGIDLVVEESDFISPAYYLSLGFAVPGSIGVQLARPGVRPLVIVGDGAFQMTGMELTTIVRYGLDPIVVVLDNGGYGTERPMLDGPFNDINPWRYAMLPDVLGGGSGYEVRTEGELDAAIDAARADRSGFSIIHVHLERGDLSPALQRLTALLAERVRGSRPTEGAASAG